MNKTLIFSFVAALISATTTAQNQQKLPKVDYGACFQAGWFYSDMGQKTHSFKAKRLRFTGSAEITERLSAFAQVETMNYVVTNDNNQASIQILDAFADYKFSDAFQVRFGQVYLPFGYGANDLSPATMETIDYSDVCERIVCRNGIGFDHIDYARDLGVVLHGDLLPTDEAYHHLSYNLAITNGGLASTTDDNNAKDVTASLIFRPIAQLNIMANYGYGEYTGLLDVLNTQYKPMHRGILGVWYTPLCGLTLRSEYGYMRSAQQGITFVEEQGFYLLASYKLKRWVPYVRYDYFDNKVDRSDYNSNYNRVLLGLNYQPMKYLRFQVNYFHAMYRDQAKLAAGTAAANWVHLVAEVSF